MTSEDQPVTAPRAPGAQKRVVVIGAGMAGLTAAYELARAGHDVKVLEARERPGGRVHTMRGFSAGLYAEAGAIHIGEHHQATRKYIAELGLKTQQVRVETGNALLHVGGKTMTFADAQANPAMLPFPLEGSEQGKTAAKMWKEATAPVRAVLARSGEQAGWETVAATYHRLTLHEFLELAGWSDAAIALFSLTSQRQPKLMCSAVDELRDLIGYAGSDVFEVAGGADRLPLAMFARIADRVRFGAQVIGMRAGRDEVIVFWRGHGGAMDTIRADYAVVATPVPVTLGFDFQPGLSRVKVKAMRAVSYLPATVTALQYTHRFWEDTPYDLKEGGTTCTDLPVRRLTYPTWAPDGTVRGVLRVQHAWTPETGLWAALSGGERLGIASGDINRLHPGSLDLFEHGASYSWSADQWAQGAFALFSPEDQAGQIAALGSPEHRVMFAGEHTSSLWHGTVEGAIESGVRAASEVHRAAV